METSYRRPNILFLRGVCVDDLKSNDSIFDRKFTTDAAQPTPRVLYQSLPEHFTTMESWPKSTNLKCWQCDCQFSNPPVFMPSDMYRGRKGEIVFDTHGCFCTFNCAQGYIDEKYRGDPTIFDKEKYLKTLYQVYTGKKIVKIVASPPKTKMQQYSGERGVSYKEYREKIYEMNDDYELAVYKLDHYGTNLV